MYLNPGKYYQHSYGGLYQRISGNLAESTVDNVQHVIYIHIYPFEQKIWLRPATEWNDGRFTELTASEVDAILIKDREELKAEIATNKATAKNK